MSARVGGGGLRSGFLCYERMGIQSILSVRNWQAID